MEILTIYNNLTIKIATGNVANGDRSLFHLPHYTAPLAETQSAFVSVYRRIEAERDEFGMPTEAAQQNLRETFGRYFRDLMNTA